MIVAGLVLAGGASSRMGGAMPKPLIEIAGRACLDRALDVLRNGCQPLLICAADPAFARPGATLVPDLRPGRLGPLAALEAADAHLRTTVSDATHLLAVPGDTPFLPPDLVVRLTAGAARRPRVARFDGRLHPTVALWPRDALAAIPQRLDDPSQGRSVLSVLDEAGFEAVEFDASAEAPGGDPFFNVNTPDDLAAAGGAGR